MWHHVTNYLIISNDKKLQYRKTEIPTRPWHKCCLYSHGSIGWSAFSTYVFLFLPHSHFISSQFHFISVSSHPIPPIPIHLTQVCPTTSSVLVLLQTCFHWVIPLLDSPLFWSLIYSHCSISFLSHASCVLVQISPHYMSDGSLPFSLRSITFIWLHFPFILSHVCSITSLYILTFIEVPRKCCT